MKIENGILISVSDNDIVDGVFNIPPDVKIIGRNAFERREGLFKVNISENVESIDNWAFAGCGLRLITIPENVTYMGNYAFYECSWLFSVTINGKISSIGHNTFSFCPFLREVKLPDSLTRIEDSAFWGAYRLSDINIPGNVYHIGAEAFSNCKSLTHINIPENAASVANDVFNGCKELKTITFDRLNRTYPCEYINSGLFVTQGNKTVRFTGISGGRALWEKVSAGSKSRHFTERENIAVGETISYAAGFIGSHPGGYKAYSDDLADYKKSAGENPFERLWLLYCICKKIAEAWGGRIMETDEPEYHYRKEHSESELTEKDVAWIERLVNDFRRSFSFVFESDEEKYENGSITELLHAIFVCLHDNIDRYT